MAVASRHRSENSFYFLLRYGQEGGSLLGEVPPEVLLKLHPSIRVNSEREAADSDRGFAHLPMSEMATLSPGEKNQRANGSASPELHSFVFHRDLNRLLQLLAKRGLKYVARCANALRFSSISFSAIRRKENELDLGRNSRIFRAASNPFFLGMQMFCLDDFWLYFEGSFN